MNNSIKQQQYLNLVFNGKNKAYGGYELRLNYQNRLTKAVSIVMAIAIGMCALSYSFSSTASNTDKKTYNDPLVLTPVNIKPPIKDKKQPLKDAKQPKVKPPKSVKSGGSSRIKPNVAATITIVADSSKINNAIKDTTTKVIIVNTDIPIGTSTTPTTGVPNTGGTSGGQGVATTANGSGSDNKNKIFDQNGVDEPSEYLGGEKAFQAYLRTNLDYPQEAIDANEEDTFEVTFILNENGKAYDFIFEQPTPSYFRASILKVLKNMPSWKPAKVEGIKVKSYKTLPITYILNL